MKPVHLYLFVAASGAIGLLWLSISPSALPSEPVLGGVLALSLAGIALVSFGAVSTRHVDHLARARRILPNPAGPPLPVLVQPPAPPQPRPSAEIISFGQYRRIFDVVGDTPELPPMLEAELNRQMLRRAERVVAPHLPLDGR